MKTVIGLIGALIVGGLLGGTLTSTSPQEVATNEVASISEVPDSSDFVSARPRIASLPAQDISENEKEGLLFMREEEKLARDVYSVLYDTWGLTIFANISQSEQTHTEAVRTLLDKYGIADPVVDDSIGKFINTDLATLYTDLIARGQKSADDALQVGALIEDLDIKDLQRYVAETDNEDIKLVYENLMKGSRNHLRAYVSQIESRGSTYNPQYLTRAEFDAIISSPRETSSAGGMGGGRGWGNR